MRRGASFILAEGNTPLSRFQRSLWISPIFFVAHGLEDASGLAEWLRWTRLFEPVSRPQTIVALAFLAVLSCASAGIAHKGTRWRVYVFVWMQGLVFLHGVAHLIPSLWLLAYTPGLVTGLLLLPVTYYSYRRAREFCPFGGKLVVLFVGASLLLYDPILRLAFHVGAIATEQNRPGHRLDNPQDRNRV